MFEIKTKVNNLGTQVDLIIHHNDKCIFFGFSYQEENRRTWTHVLITPPFEEERQSSNHYGWHGAYKRLYLEAWKAIRKAFLEQLP